MYSALPPSITLTTSAERPCYVDVTDPKLHEIEQTPEQEISAVVFKDSYDNLLVRKVLQLCVPVSEFHNRQETGYGATLQLSLNDTTRPDLHQVKVYPET